MTDSRDTCANRRAKAYNVNLKLVSTGKKRRRGQEDKSRREKRREEKIIEHRWHTKLLHIPELKRMNGDGDYGNDVQVKLAPYQCVSCPDSPTTSASS